MEKRGLDPVKLLISIFSDNVTVLLPNLRVRNFLDRRFLWNFLLTRAGTVFRFPNMVFLSTP